MTTMPPLFPKTVLMYEVFIHFRKQIFKIKSAAVEPDGEIISML
jgi:hypothetical protein